MRYFYEFTGAQGFTVKDSDDMESSVFSHRDETYCQKWCDRMNAQEALEKDKNPAAVALGSLGGKAKSEAKAKTSAANGAKGGRPKIIRSANGRIEYAYKFALIEREEDGKRINWACHVDGARRNFRTLKAAKLHVDNVETGIDHQGLR
jgi:hypothetical protein